MRSFYASDETARELTRPGTTSAYNIYFKDDAQDKFLGIVGEANWIMEALTEILQLNADLSFVIVASSCPYQAVYKNDKFIILIDEIYFYRLCHFCLRIQSLNPLADLLRIKPIAENTDYRGFYLLDIARDIILKYDQEKNLLIPDNPKELVRAAFAYILAHEVAHVAHGHLEFRLSPCFAQFSTTENDRNLTLRTLEMDADSSATTSVVTIFESLLSKLLQQYNSSSTLDRDEISNMTRRRYVAGMYIALLFLDAVTTNHNTVRHPIGYARFLTTMSVAGIALMRISPQATFALEFVRQKIVDTFVCLSGNLENLGHPMATNIEIRFNDFVIPVYHPKGILEGYSHIDPLLTRWSEVRPHLETFLRGGILAPVRQVSS